MPYRTRIMTALVSSLKNRFFDGLIESFETFTFGVQNGRAKSNSVPLLGAKMILTHEDTYE